MKNYSWYSSKQKDKSPDSIHQVLQFGSLEDIKKLRITVVEENLRELFLSYPKKNYTPASLNFILKFILHIKKVDEQKYLKSTPRNTR